MKIGDEVYVHGYIDEIRNDVIIIRNDGGYFGTVPSEVVDQEPTAEYSSDVISRQAAIDGVKTLHDVAWKKWHEPTLSTNAVLDMIRELPSAQPFTTEQIQTMQELESAQIEKAYELGKADRPKGHWIEHDDERVLCECSECHEKYLLYEEHVLGRNFCPNCGCAMKGGEEE